MKRIDSAVISLLACVVILSHGTANAQGRGPDARALREEAQARSLAKASDSEIRAAKLAELDAFLRRLIGRFRYEGEVKLFWGSTGSVMPAMGCDGSGCYVRENADGVGDCVAVGKGPGVHCAINIPWPRFSQPLIMNSARELRWEGPYLDGAMTLYGIDPDQLGIRFLLVDSQSLVQTELGLLKDDTLTFETKCPAVTEVTCTRTFRIQAPKDGRRLEMQYDLRYGSRHWAEYRFSLHRESAFPLEAPD